MNGYRSASALLLCLIVWAGARPDAQSRPTPWLDRVNFYRATALLPPVVEDAALSAAVSRHAQYMLLHDVMRHSQDPRQRWATLEGAAAAAASNLAASTRPNEDETWAVDLWMQAPFHALGILDPALQRVGFAIDHDRRGDIQTAAGLDVIQGRAIGTSAPAAPIVWPANGATVPIGTHLSEYPDPLSSCRGYSAPAGLPLVVQLGPHAGRGGITASWIVEGDTALDHCVFDEQTYRNHDSVQERLGRSILASRHAIVLIPRAPLRPGTAYRAVVDVSGQTLDWTFSIR